jgi:hypothetical protein
MTGYHLRVADVVGSCDPKGFVCRYAGTAPVAWRQRATGSRSGAKRAIDRAGDLLA